MPRLLKYAALYLVVLCTLILAAGLLTGCTRLIELDRNIWSPLTATQDEIDQGQTPPLLEVIAGALATIGFAGMALWIRHNKKRACTKDDLTSALNKNNLSP